MSPVELPALEGEAELRDQVSPTQFCARDEVALLLEVPPPPAAPDVPEPISPLTVQAKEICVAEPEPFEFWLFSRRSPWTKLAMAAAVLLAVLTAGLVGQDWYASRVRASAFAELNRAGADLDAEAGRAALHRLDTAPPLSDQGAFRQATARLKSEVRHWEALRQRDRAFARLQQAIAEHDGPMASDAVRAFLANHDADLTDPREAAVRGVERQLAGLGRRKVRDEEYLKLVAAYSHRDDKAVLAAAVAFQPSLQAGDDEPRKDQVVAL